MPTASLVPVGRNHQIRPSGTYNGLITEMDPGKEIPMTSPNPEGTATTETTTSTTTANPVTEAEATAAVQKAASTLPENPTGKDFAEMINALPERIVDALREATATTATKTTEEKTEVKTADPKGGAFFGYDSFGEWFFGTKKS